MSLDDAYAKVAEFHTAFGHPCAGCPTPVERQRRVLRAKWMQEEIQEWIDAEGLVDQVDAVVDLLYFALGSLVELGVKPDNLFDIIHNSNMAKLWPDGTVRYKSDGKVHKPPAWAGPEEEIAKVIVAMSAAPPSAVTDDLCLPLCLSELARRVFNRDVKVDELTRRLLPASRFPFQSDDLKIGYLPDCANLAKTFGELSCPAKFELHRASFISELNFDSVIRDYIAEGAGVIGLFSAGYLFQHERTDLGHAAIVEEVKQKEVILYDPSERSISPRISVRIDDFYGACRLRAGGILILKPQRLTECNTPIFEDVEINKSRVL